MPTGVELREDKQFVEGAGYTVTVLNTPRATGTWYREDGKAIPNLPVDPYHRKLYRGKGWTLKPPAAAQVGQAQAATIVEVITGPSPSKATPGAELKPISPPPRHIHVMEAPIGSPCLVRGCSASRSKPPGKFNIPKAKKVRKRKEVSHVQ